MCPYDYFLRFFAKAGESAMKKLRLSYYQKLVASHLMVLMLTVTIMAAFNYAFSRDQQNDRMLDVVSYSGQQTAAGIEARLARVR